MTAFFRYLPHARCLWLLLRHLDVSGAFVGEV